MRILLRMNLRMILPKHRSIMKFGLQMAYIYPIAGLQKDQMEHPR